jgi:hypothetical protein
VTAEKNTLEEKMAEFVDYAQLYVQGKTAKNTGDQALYSKRLLEYTMAKDTGGNALNALNERWAREDKDAAERQAKNQAIGAMIGIIVLVGFLIICVWALSL